MRHLQGRGLDKASLTELEVAAAKIRRRIAVSDKPAMTKLIALMIVEHMYTDRMEAFPSKEWLMKLCSIKNERIIRIHYQKALEFLTYLS